MAKVFPALFTLIALQLVMAVAGPAKSATLVISETALQKLIDSKFINGKIPIGPQDDCNNPYIDTAHITLSGGRVEVAGHLSGHAGTKLGGICVAPAIASDFTISGVPAVSGSVVRLADIKLDSIENKKLELPLGLLLRSAAENSVQADLRPIAENALKKTAPYAMTLDSLQLQNLDARDNTLTVDFDFKLTMQ